MSGSGDTGRNMCDWATNGLKKHGLQHSDNEMILFAQYKKQSCHKLALLCYFFIILMARYYSTIMRSNFIYIKAGQRELEHIICLYWWSGDG